MPYVRKRKMSTRKRTTRKTGRTNYRPSNSWNSKALQKINRRGATSALTGFPERMTVSLPYVISGRVNPGIVAYNDQVILLNSCFDPDFSGVGHQPRGYDQWTAIYNQYRVSRVDVNILVRQRASHGINVRAIANNQSASFAADYNLAEFVQHSYVGQTAANTPPLQKKLTYFPHKVLGIDWKEYIANESTAATISSSPSEAVFLHIVVQQVDQTTAVDFEYEIQLVYRVMFFDRQNLAIS